jgi:hypothetical protein
LCRHDDESLHLNPKNEETRKKRAEAAAALAKKN